MTRDQLEKSCTMLLPMLCLSRYLDDRKSEG